MKNTDIDPILILLTICFFILVGFFGYSFVANLGFKEMSGLVSGSVALVAAFTSYLGSKKNTNKTMEIQEAISSNRIDADIRAQARIAWIQTIKKDTATLISVSNQLINKIREYDEVLSNPLAEDRGMFDFEILNGYSENISKKRLDCLQDIMELSDRLTGQASILFAQFGKEKEEKMSYNDYQSLLKDRESEFKTLLEFGINDEEKIDLEEDFKNFIEVLRNTDNNILKNEKIVAILNLIIFYCPKDIYEINKRVNEKNCENYYRIGILSHCLSNIIRQYNKIEWDIAKEGK